MPTHFKVEIRYEWTPCVVGKDLDGVFEVEFQCTTRKQAETLCAALNQDELWLQVTVLEKP